MFKYRNIMMSRIEPMALPQPHAPETSAELERMVENAREASELLKALAQESRLLILCVLAGGEKSVGELEAFLSQRQSTVSQQLARLRLEGLVTTRRVGKTIHYSLANDKVRAILDALTRVFRPQEPVGER
jgi:DNA-binding transcriptional ArsR family regulator